MSTEQVEIPKLLREKVYPVREFDHLVSSDRGFRRKIAGFTTFSLRQLLRGVTADGFSIVKYKGWGEGGHIHCDMVKPAQRRAFPSYDQPRYGNTLKDNRAYASWWTAMEVYEELPGLPDYNPADYNPEVTVKFIDECFREITFLRKAYKTLVRGDEKTAFDKASELMVKSGRGRIDILELFCGKTNLHHFIDKLQHRGGVQVVYGGRYSFVRLLQDCSEPVDDWGVRVYRDIPADLVIAVLPLGLYEQKALLASLHPCKLNVASQG